MRIVIPVYDGVDLLDVCGPSELFNWAKFGVELVTRKPGPVRFANGFEINAMQGLTSVTSCDALWVPGGEPAALSALMYGADQSYIQFLVAQAAVSQYVCSVCEGALLLAQARLLDGYAATTHWAFIPYLLEKFPAISIADGHPRYVLDRNRLTGGGVSSGLDESLRLIELLGGTPLAQSVQQNAQYYPVPPVSSEIPNVIQSPMPAVQGETLAA
ncbi:DJ-1/PfpI family protein [Sphingomonas sp. PR090111-T3T-6A]|uniref:DJ-1/PfpI family protein n=1 Tax=Sphingomonas sp. PR090111-T3T-6A TaxID=685778 RepID=UPI0003626317|nr:DJ-1/PfpI family protein [Sphingomonas sp. PR090111-T3T-6A]